jgi:hypothetical protein
MFNNKFLIITSQHEVYEKYEYVFMHFIEVFYAPSIEIASLLLKRHKFDFAIMDDEMYGRIPGVHPQYAIHRASLEYGSKFLEKSKTPYFILSKRENILQTPVLKYCLHFGYFLSPDGIERIVREKKIFFIS